MTVEQQFIPALAIASAVSGHAKKKIITLKSIIMKQITIKQLISGSNQIVSTKITKYAALYFLLISTILILHSCLVYTHGKSPERLKNDVVEYKIYMTQFAKLEQVENKLKELIDKELSGNNYVDYVILYQHQQYPTHTVKFFKTMQDKQSFLNKKERFIKLVQSNINEIRNGMTYDNLADLLKIKESDYEISKGLISHLEIGHGKNLIVTIEDYEIEYYLFLKVENGILKEWHIIK